MKMSLFFFFLFFYVFAFGQEELQSKVQQKVGRSLGISLGVNDFHFRDNYLSPHIFSKTMFSSAISYQFNAKRYFHSIDLSYGFGHPNSDIQPRNVSENIGSISYAISRVINASNIAGHRLELSLGAGVSTFIVSTNFNAIDRRYNYVWNEQSWYCSNSLNLHLGGEYQIHDRKSFSMHITLPMFRLVARPENGHIYNNENAKVIDRFFNVVVQGKPEWFWDNASLAYELGYKQPLGKCTNLKLNYLFNYITSDRPLHLQMYMNRFMVGFEFLL